MVMIVFSGLADSYETSETFWENILAIACTLPSQNHIYTDLPPASLEWFLKAVWGAVS